MICDVLAPPAPPDCVETGRMSVCAVRAMAEALDQLHVGFCLFDGDDRTVFWNRSFLRLFPEHDGRVFAGEPYAENLRRFYRARLSPAELASLERCVADGVARHRAQTQPFVFEHRNQWVRVTAQDFPGLGRARIWTPIAPPGAVAPAAEPEEMPFLPGGSDGRSVLGPRGRVERCNESFAHFFRLPSPEAALGLTHADLVAAAWNDGPEGAAEALRILAEGERFSGVPFELPLPGPLWLRVLQQRLADGRVVSSFADITATKRLQRELEEAREAAERANRAKDAFLAMAGHELRTPLGGILGMLSLLEGDGLPPGPAGRVAVARQSAEALLRVVDDILDFSRLESGHVEIRRAPLDPAGLAGEVATLLAPRAVEKGVDLRLDIGPGVPPRILADGARLRQVLLNLVSNALKFTARGEVALVLSRNGKALKIAVTDTGIGIEPSALSRVFEPFVQADSGIARRYGGTGLGLSICQHLVRAMGGEIVAASEQGRGSAFTVSLPCEATTATAAADAARLPAPAPLPALPPAHVLVVDDNPVNREVARLLLERLGLLVTTASGEAEALAACAEPIDLVLMDLEMPGADGLTVMASMRQSGLPGGSAPFVAMTAHAGQERRSQCEAAGMEGYLVKPVEAQALAETVAGILRRPPPVLLDEERVEGFAALLPGPRWDALLEDFRVAAETAIAGLEAAPDATTRAQAAHGLKGAAWNLGAKSLGDFAAELEKTPSGAEAVRARLPKLRAAVEASLAALRERRRPG